MNTLKTSFAVMYLSSLLFVWSKRNLVSPFLLCVNSHQQAEFKVVWKPNSAGKNKRQERKSQE